MFEMRGIYKEFEIGSFRNKKTVYALNDINLKIKNQEILGLVGESGSGKTTVARVVERIYAPTKGEIALEGKTVPKKMNRKEIKKYRKEVQMIFQDPFSSLNPLHSIQYILSRPYKIHHFLGKKNMEKEILNQLKIIGLIPPENFIKKYPYELSGGQRQRIGIARALSVEPKLVLADEPTSMLDVSIRLDIMNLILDLKEQKRVSFLFITHDLAGARYISDRIAIMYAGFIVEIGSSNDVIDHPLHPYTELLKKAAPKPELGLKPDLIEESESIPNLTQKFTSCPFSPRCEKKQAICDQKLPPIVEIEPGRFVRCFLYSNYL